MPVKNNNDKKLQTPPHSLKGFITESIDFVNIAPVLRWLAGVFHISLSASAFGFHI